MARCNIVGELASKGSVDNCGTSSANSSSTMPARRDAVNHSSDTVELPAAAAAATLLSSTEDPTTGIDEGRLLFLSF